jgi:predicted nucleotidyltransferase
MIYFLRSNRSPNLPDDEGYEMKSLAEAPLTERDIRAVKAAVEMLMERFPVEKVILYGSKGRGDSDEDSDIDLLLVTSRAIHWLERKTIIDALFDIEMAHDALISILVVPVNEWSGGIFAALPIYHEVMRDGVLAA